MHPIRRVAIVGLAAVASMAVLTASLPAGATATGGIVTCDQVTGSQFGPAQLYSCTASTGGAASIEPYPFFVAGTHTGTIYWSQPSTTQHLTTVIRARTRVVTKKGNPCGSGSEELNVAGSVRSDTSGVVTVGGPVSAILCQANGSFQLLKNTTIVIG
jgi:hypothetical protein